MSDKKYNNEIEESVNKLEETYCNEIQINDEVLELITAKALDLVTYNLFNSEVEQVSDDVDWNNVTFESIYEETNDNDQIVKKIKWIIENLIPGAEYNFTEDDKLED